MTSLPLTAALRDLSAWVTHFDAQDIPVLAETAAQLEMWRANEDAVDANLLGQLFERDPLMSLKVLRHASTQRSSRLLADAETPTAALVLMGITPFFNFFGPQPTIEAHLASRPDALEGVMRVLRRSERGARFALGFAAHRLDRDAAVLHQAALLHDFVELLLWCHAPDLALEIAALQRANPALRSKDAQKQVLNITLSELEQTLMIRWRLPTLLRRAIDDRPQADPQVQTVQYAARLARHSASGWHDAALPDDLDDISKLLTLSRPHTLKLLREIDEEVAPSCAL